jgi:hypothetical protein
MEYSFFDPNEESLELYEIKIKNLEEIHYMETQKGLEENHVLDQISAELEIMKQAYIDAGGTL